MATDAEETGFLSRWSRRKALVREGLPMVEAAVVSPSAPALPVQPEVPEVPAVPLQVAPPQTAEQPEPAPTLADVAELTRESDFSRFVGRSVQPDVKNAALGKLFTDPHFNVMDGLDVYIDDYGKPDPLPPGMLRQMLQAHVLGLFDDEDKDKDKNPAAIAVAADPDPAETTAGTTAETTAAAPLLSEPTADENTALQLQPDDDPGRTGLAPGAVENRGRTDRRA